MKALKGVLITLVVIIAIVGVTVIGGYVAVRSKYGIDLFRTAGQLKTLSQDVDESALCPNAYGEQDFVEMKSAVNDKIDGLIVYEKGKGYNGYSVNFASLAGKSMTDPIFLTEKHVGAIAQTVFYEQTGGKIKLGEKEVSVTVMQVDFSEIAANGSADLTSLQNSTLRRSKRIWAVSRINTSKNISPITFTFRPPCAWIRRKKTAFLTKCRTNPSRSTICPATIPRICSTP